MGKPSQNLIDLVDLEKFTDTRNCMLLLLGRSGSSPREIRAFENTRIIDQMISHTSSREFEIEIEASIVLNGYVSGWRFQTEPSQRLLTWIQSKVPLEQATLDLIDNTNCWRDLGKAVWSDTKFRSLFHLTKLTKSRIDQIISGLHSIDDRELWAPRADGSRSMDKRSSHLEMVAFARNATRARSETTINLLNSVKNMFRTGIRRTGIIRKRKVGFEAVENDPQIIFQSIDPGRYHFQLLISFNNNHNSTNNDYTQLFLDLGDGHKEEHSLKFPIYNNCSSANVYLKFTKHTGTIRLDPCVNPSYFNIEYCVLDRL